MGHRDGILRPDRASGATPVAGLIANRHAQPTRGIIVLLRLVAAASLLALWSVLGASVALAADPPADVVLDGTVTVTFADPSIDDGAGIAGAEVTLEARRP